MIIGITGTDGAGEKVRNTFARGCLVFLKLALKNTDNLNSSCKERVRRARFYYLTTHSITI